MVFLMLICFYTLDINPLGHHVLFFNTGGFDMVIFYLRFSYQFSDYVVFSLFPYLSSSVFATHLPLIFPNQSVLVKLKTKVFNRDHKTLYKPFTQPPWMHLLFHLFRCSPLSLLCLESATYILAFEHLPSLFPPLGMFSSTYLYGHFHLSSCDIYLHLCLFVVDLQTIKMWVLRELGFYSFCFVLFNFHCCNPISDYAWTMESTQEN